MRYNTFSNDELERAIYIDPTNSAARAEMLARLPALMDEQTDEAEDLAIELEVAKKDHETEIADMEDELNQADTTINSLRNQLDEAEDRIAYLTRVPDPRHGPSVTATNESNPMPAPTDNINNPKHYTSHPSGIQCIQITEHMSFNLGNAIKYLWRADEKGAPLDDLKKARWYIDREISKRERAQQAAA